MPSQPPPPSIETPPAPGINPPSAHTNGRGALLRIVLALAVGASLSTDRLLGAAEHMAYGSSRSTLVAITEAAHASAVGVGLNQPSIVIDDMMGREPSQEVAATVDYVPLVGERATPEPEERPPLRSMRVPVEPVPVPAEVEVPETTTTTEPPEPVLRSIDHNEKLRVWAGGDSLGEYVGNQLLFPISDTDLTDVELSYHISTGLARPDYFNWLAEIGGVMNQPSPPEALVFMVGGNDDQNMLRDADVLEVGSEPWYDEYRHRVSTFMDTGATADGSSHLYWIGLPPMREIERETISVEINQIIGSEAETRPWVTFVDIYSLFTGPDGGFQAQLIGPEGKQRVARAPDGVHITFAGSTWVADQVWTAIEDRWQLPDEAADVTTGEPELVPDELVPEGLSMPEGLPAHDTRPEPGGVTQPMAVGSRPVR